MFYAPPGAQDQLGGEGGAVDKALFLNSVRHNTVPQNNHSLKKLSHAFGSHLAMKSGAVQVG